LPGSLGRWAGGVASLGGEAGLAEAGFVHRAEDGAHLAVAGSPIGVEDQAAVGGGVGRGAQGRHQALVRQPHPVEAEGAVGWGGGRSFRGWAVFARRAGWSVTGSATAGSCASIGVTTMKMIRSTRQTSTRGVTLISLRTAATACGRRAFGRTGSSLLSVYWIGPAGAAASSLSTGS